MSDTPQSGRGRAGTSGEDPASPNPNSNTTNTAPSYAAAAASSPTSTIRQPRPAAAPSPLGIGGLALPGSNLSPHRIGIGRPGGSDFRSPGSSPATPLSPPQGVAVPGRAGSISSIDDSDDGESHATPRTAAGGYFPPMEPMSRRVSDVRSAQGSQSGHQRSPTPAGQHNTGSGGHGQSARPRLNMKDSEAPQQRSAAVSRSASRARLAPPHQPAPTLKDMDDDEVEFIDRGEDLIRRRIKERKRAKRERERERRLAAAEAAGEEEDDDGEDPNSVPTSAQTETFAPRTALSPVRPGRAYSRARASSAGSRHPSQSGYPSLAGSVSDVERAESLLSVPTEENSDDLAADEAGETQGPTPMEEEPCESCSSGNEEDDESGSNEEAEGVTVRDRQDAINIEHPFGLPIWKPALYRKSRSVTRNAESALHSMPSAAAERHLLPGNILWTVMFGWWLALSCFAVAVVVSAVEQLAGGRGGYGATLRGLAWYIGWPFGKYVEGEGAPDNHDDDDSETAREDTPPRDEENNNYGSTATGAADQAQFINPFQQRTLTASTSSTVTVRPSDLMRDEPVSPTEPIRSIGRRGHGVSFAPGVKSPDESVPLLRTCRKKLNRRARQLGRLAYWPGFFLVVAPAMLFVCICCWFLVITIPMAKLTWELLCLLYYRPLEISFRSAPKIPVPDADVKDNSNGNGAAAGDNATGSPTSSLRHARLQAGQVAPTAGPTSTVLLCTYRAVGLQYYKYTVGGVNIMFINLLPLVFFTIFDGIFLLPMVEKAHEEGRPVPPLLALVASQALIFVLGLASVIPLSYFLGMAVASISAQSSIGMGAVINATFGSIIEIVLYAIALTQGKGRLVEGSIVGSILAGVLLMPGMSMCSGALKRKEQKFNAKSAGVTSTMLIMAIIGTLTPTMFYQTYGSFQIHCEGCPRPGEVIHDPDEAWKCNRCFYEYPEPTTDPFYQNQVKSLMYACAAILLLSYLIGLWFSLRTHASQIWQNPQQVMAKEEIHPVARTLARITPSAVNNPVLPVHQQHHHKTGSVDGAATPRRVVSSSPHRRIGNRTPSSEHPPSPLTTRKELAPADAARSDARAPGSDARGPGDSPEALYPRTGYTPLLESFNANKAGNMDGIPPLPAQMTHEDFRRAVHTIATAMRDKKALHVEDDGSDGGGHEAPSWTRGVSAAVLLGCTLLYAIIAEILVDVVDVVLAGSGVDEKFLGLTLFALVPNTTEFMNAMSFAMHGNIALSMEIGSAYALQVCLLQIPAMVAFSAFSNPAKFGDQIDTFTLIFPRWDVIAIILSIFLLTYTYIEARSNYHRGSILVLAYCVLVMGFYYAPARTADTDGGGVVVGYEHVANVASSLSASVSSSMSLAMSKLWAYPSAA